MSVAKLLRKLGFLTSVFVWVPGNAAAAVIVRGPYLQANTASTITVRWRTDVPVPTFLRYGETMETQESIVASESVATEHQVSIAGLLPDSRYFYTLSDGIAPLAGGDASHFFRTTPVPGTDRPTRVWILGDSGTGGDGTGRAESVRDAYLNSPLLAYNDVWLMLGDNAYGAGRDDEYQIAVFDVFPMLLRNTVLWSTLGNHETYGVDVPYFDIFTFPKSGEGGGLPSGTENYYAFDFGQIHFVCLDSMLTNRLPGSPMLEWLKYDLESTRQKWIIAFFHHPPYTKGSHDSDLEIELVEMRENVLPILEAGGVDLVLGGHSHCYERSMLVDGHYGSSTTLTPEMIRDATDGRGDGAGVYGKDPEPHAGTVYAVAGSSGQASGGPLNHPVMYASLNVMGSMILDVAGNRLDARFLDDQGVVRDSFSISKAPLVTLASAATKLPEASQEAVRVTLSRTRDLNAPLTAKLTLGGTAMLGVDYEELASQFVIPAGERSMSFSIRAIPDNTAEGPETVILTTSDGVGYRVKRGSSSSLLTIEDRPLDNWRFAKFGQDANTALIAGDRADPDGDGVENVLEFLAGTEPLDPASRFMAVAQRNAAGEPVVHFTAQRARRYTVEFKNELGEASWQFLNEVAASSEIRDVEIPDPSAGGRLRRFYRVSAHLE